MSFRSDALKSTLALAIDTYKDLERVSALLDDKAQKVGGLAGLFVAAAFGFLKPTDAANFSASLGLSTVVLFIAALTTFVLCLACCLSVMWVRDRPSMLTLAPLLDIHRDLSVLQSSEISEAIEQSFYFQNLELWKKIHTVQRAVNTRKGARLKHAQILLGSGMLLVATILTTVMVRTLIQHGG